MKVLFDTSVVVAAIQMAHAKHPEAHTWLTRAKEGGFELVMSAHSIAECYAVLSTLPIRPRYSTQQAWEVLQENVVRKARIVSLSDADYLAVIQELASLGVSGGSTYDAVTARVARNERVDVLLTLNPRHFLRVWPEGAEKIRVP